MEGKSRTRGSAKCERRVREAFADDGVDVVCFYDIFRCACLHHLCLKDDILHEMIFFSLFSSPFSLSQDVLDAEHAIWTQGQLTEMELKKSTILADAWTENITASV